MNRVLVYYHQDHRKGKNWIFMISFLETSLILVVIGGGGCNGKN